MRNIKLLSVIGDSDILLLKHFLDYYISIGIKVENILLGIHCKKFSSIKRMLLILDTYNIEPKFLWTGPWQTDKAEDTLDKKKFILNLFINRYVRSEDWIIVSDADEQHQYPKELPALIKECEGNFDFVKSFWIDRVSNSGEFIDVHPHVSLSKQFPVGTVISKELFKKRRKSIQKIILAKKDVDFTNGGCHSVENTDWVSYPEFGFTHHYKWSIDILPKMKKRSESWYATDGLNEALAFMKLYKVNGGKIILENLSWSFNFENPSLNINILNQETYSGIDLNIELWEKISWIKSFMYERALGPFNNPIPWNTFSLIHFIRENTYFIKKKKVFEYGSGSSTLFLSQFVEKIYSVEYNKDWYNFLDKQLKDIKSVDLIYRKVDINGDYSEAINVPDEKFDIIIIDGRDRVNCLKKSISKLKKDGVIIFDDSQRLKYKKGIEYALSLGFDKKDFKGISPGDVNIDSCTTIFFKEDNIFNL